MKVKNNFTIELFPKPRMLNLFHTPLMSFPPGSRMRILYYTYFIKSKITFSHDFIKDSLKGRVRFFSPTVPDIINHKMESLIWNILYLEDVSSIFVY